METNNIHDRLIPFLSEKAQVIAKTHVPVIDGTEEDPTVIISDPPDDEVTLTARYIGRTIAGDAPTDEDLQHLATMVNRAVEHGLLEHGILVPTYHMPLLSRQGGLLIFVGFSRYDLEYLKANNDKVSHNLPKVTLKIREEFQQQIQEKAKTIVEEIAGMK